MQTCREKQGGREKKKENYTKPLASVAARLFPSSFWSPSPWLPACLPSVHSLVFLSRRQLSSVTGYHCSLHSQQAPAWWQLPLAPLKDYILPSPSPGLFLCLARRETALAAGIKQNWCALLNETSWTCGGGRGPSQKEITACPVCPRAESCKSRLVAWIIHSTRT